MSSDMGWMPASLGSCAIPIASASACALHLGGERHGRSCDEFFGSLSLRAPSSWRVPPMDSFSESTGRASTRSCSSRRICIIALQSGPRPRRRGNDRRRASCDASTVHAATRHRASEAPLAGVQGQGIARATRGVCATWPQGQWRAAPSPWSRSSSGHVTLARSMRMNGACCSLPAW
jgi:hypothetical protein